MLYFPHKPYASQDRIMALFIEVGETLCWFWLR